jgi:hypothetical protein
VSGCSSATPLASSENAPSAANVGDLYLQVYIVLPNRAGDDFVAHSITLAHVQDLLLASIARLFVKNRSWRRSGATWWKKMLTAFGAALLDRNDGLQKKRP